MYMFLDFKLSFREHLEKILAKVNAKSKRGIANLQSALPREALLAIYKSFIHLHFDYAM